MTSPLTRRSVLRAGTGSLAAGALASRGARAQQGAAFPTRPITMLVGYPPGGQTDFIARVIQNSMTNTLGQSVVVENRGGAGGNIATEAVLRARPDGHTLLVGNAIPITINPHTFPGMKIDPRQLEPVGLMMQSPLVLSVHPSVPARNLAEFAEWARGQRNGVTYGSVGAGSSTHAAMELLRSRIGNPEMTHVPYRGSGPANQDFIAGRFSAMFDGLSPALPFAQAGQIRPILVTGEHRSRVLPDVRTAAEQGLQDFNFTAWIGLFAPPQTPADIVQRVNAALNAALQDPQVRERITTVGEEPGGGTADDLKGRVARDYDLWGKVARDHNIRSDA